MSKAPSRARRPRKAAQRGVRGKYFENQDNDISDGSSAGADPDFTLVQDGELDWDLDDDQRSRSGGDSEFEDLALQDDRVDIEDVLDAEDQIRLFEADGVSTPRGDAEDVDLDALFDGNLQPPEYYRKGIETFDVSDYRRKQYAKGTEKLIRTTETQWRSFCIKILRKKDWQGRLRHINIQTVYHFLNWHLGQRTSQNGRRKRPIRSRSSLVTFWCCFRLTFQRVANRKIDTNIDRDLLHNVLVKLGDKFKLTHKTRENRSMTLDDLKLQLETTLRTTEKGFRLGELRILAVLFLLLLAPQGSRPRSILELKFRDLQLMLIRDPKDPKGSPRLVVELSVAFTKRYLGPKAEKTFIIPEILYDPSLLLSPHVFLLAILFRHRAFVSKSLNDDPSELSRLRIPPWKNELRLDLNDDVRKEYVFRQYKKTPFGYEMSSMPITQGMMGSWVRRIGKLIGFKNNTICYNLRYMAGNNMDGTISDALRNLVMDHAPNSDTFQKHYLNRNVCVDLWALHRGEEPQNDLLKQVASHGASRNPYRPISLTKEQSESIKASDPQYQRLRRQLEKTPRVSHKRIELSNRLKQVWAKLRDKGIEKAREEWDRAQALDDIERQIRGAPGVFSRQTERASQPMSPAQKRMLDGLQAPLINNLQAQFERRHRAIMAIIAYCSIEEPLSNKITDAQRAARPPELTMELDPMERARQYRSSVYGPVGKVRKCFFCIAVALTLFPDDPNLPGRTRAFYNHGTLSKHFINSHLKPLDNDAKMTCPVCIPVVSLQNKMHLQSHAEVVHGIKTHVIRRKRIDSPPRDTHCH